MARSRNIKPSFFDNDKLAENDPLARILFIGLWTLADYRGNLEWRTKRIKAKILPYDDCDIEKLAINLDKSRFIRFYSDGDILYCNVVNFSSHQNPHKNERDKGTNIPDYSEDMRQVVDLEGLTINRDKSRSIRNDSASDRADSLFLIPDSLNPIPDSHTHTHTILSAAIPVEWAQAAENYFLEVGAGDLHVDEVWNRFREYHLDNKTVSTDWLLKWKNWCADSKTLLRSISYKKLESLG